MKEKFIELTNQYMDEIIRTASELIQINSQSTQEGKVAQYTVNKMKALGYDEVVVDAYGSVFGTVKGTGGGNSVMLNCHLDVVDEGDESKWKLMNASACTFLASSGRLLKLTVLSLSRVM